MQISDLERRYYNQIKQIERLGKENSKLRIAIDNIRKEIKDFKETTHTDHTVWDVMSCDKVLEIIDAHMEELKDD